MSEPPAVADIDGLFELPLGDFTSARNALSAQLKKTGRAREAGEIKALVKPSISAWAVNQLYWRHRKPFDRLLEAGEGLRRAQLTGNSAREAIDARRAAVVELTGIAAGVLRDAGFGATLDMLRRITTTLEALSSYGSVPGAPAVGRLVDDVDPPGFEAVAGLLQGGRVRPASEQLSMPLSKPAARPQQRPDKRVDAAKAREEQKRLLAAANAAVREAERAAAAARKRAERASAESNAAAARVQEIAKEREQIEKQLARVSKELAAAHERARNAAAGATAACASADGAEHALEQARRRLQQVASAKP